MIATYQDMQSAALAGRGGYTCRLDGTRRSETGAKRMPEAYLEVELCGDYPHNFVNN